MPSLEAIPTRCRAADAADDTSENRGNKQRIVLREPEKRRSAVRLAQIAMLACLFAGPALMCIRAADMSDCDIWWHLRTGEWISSHHSVPRLEPFSGPAGGSPYVAYSWVFELLIFLLFHSLGMVGFVAYTAALVFLITVVLYFTVQCDGVEVPAAALLTFACMYGMGHLFMPRPWLCTILLFMCEMAVLLDIRRTGARRHLLWLPAIFALWANVHIQFVDGLFVLGLAVLEAALSRWWRGAQRRVPVLPLSAAFAASVVATLVNPYGWRVYAVARDLATQTGALDKISELQAIPFRDLSAYVILLLALGSAAILGRERRVLSFDGALLTFSALLCFRSQRDVWVLAVVAAVILAPALPKARTSVERPSKRMVVLALGAAALIIVGSFPLLRVDNARLEARLARQMPVRAAEYIRGHNHAGPVFNDFNWGGYFIWSLRTPVSIDGRQNVYGDRRMDRSLDTWSGKSNWSSDPDLASAGVVIGPVRAPLTQILRRDPRFQLAYQDGLAAVFASRR